MPCLGGRSSAPESENLPLSLIKPMWQRAMGAEAMNMKYRRVICQASPGSVVSDGSGVSAEVDHPLSDSSCLLLVLPDLMLSDLTAGASSV